MTLNELNNKIKSAKLSGAFFFYGTEQYLLSKKVSEIKKKLIPSGTEIFNYVKFDDKNILINDVISAIDRFPQMSDIKVIVVKNSGFFNNAKLSEYKLMKDAVNTLPSDTCLIFIESDFDKKKLKNLSCFEESGGVLNFEPIPLNKMSVWVEEEFKKSGKSILSKDIKYLYELCNQSFAKISAEVSKLISFTAERQKITREDIDLCVERSVEYQVYDMINSMINGSSKKAYEQLKYLYDTKTDPFQILSIMTSRLNDLLTAKLLSEDGLSASEINGYFDYKKPDFAVKITINESRNFSEEYLKRMIDRGLFYDSECKSGNLDRFKAVEMYLAELTIR